MAKCRIKGCTGTAAIAKTPDMAGLCKQHQQSQADSFGRMGAMAQSFRDTWRGNEQGLKDWQDAVGRMPAGGVYDYRKMSEAIVDNLLEGDLFDPSDMARDVVVGAAKPRLFAPYRIIGGLKVWVASGGGRSYTPVMFSQNERDLIQAHPEDYNGDFEDVVWEPQPLAEPLPEPDWDTSPMPDEEELRRMPTFDPEEMAADVLSGVMNAPYRKAFAAWHSNPPTGSHITRYAWEAALNALGYTDSHSMKNFAFELEVVQAECKALTPTPKSVNDYAVYVIEPKCEQFGLDLKDAQALVRLWKAVVLR